MRRRIFFAAVVLTLVSACSLPTTGDEAKAHAEELGFEVAGVDDDSAVVKIGEHCNGEFTVWSHGNGDQINRVYLNGEDIWNLLDTKAEGPDQFRGFARTAECYDE